MTKILIYSGARQGVPTERLWNEKMAAVPIFIKEHKSVIGTAITASINLINIHGKVMAAFFRSRPSTPILITQPP